MDTNGLAYLQATNCLTVTCICDDGTIAGGYVVLEPFSLWYVTSNVTSLLQGKHITTVCLIGSTVWNDIPQLEAIFYSGTDESYYPDSRGGNVQKERYYLADVIAHRGGVEGVESAVSMILGGGKFNFFSALYEGELDVEFLGGKDEVTLTVNGEEQEFPYILK